ncbi:hypothetical protein K402DRAFT_392155 [Aulographum hederae CBS 113979]|uniref:Uncharacterized protein n=1 Tax=Aulographum hederae CBS 113979 TaxID=1176131 RepID=A0A6G1H477_9PEZI|nr:hypothetical protein K402DRAFT_392155 [Aulographum hederae CBS 113979]
MYPHNRMSSFGPDPHVFCQIYSDEKCQGKFRQGMYPGIGDLRLEPFDMDNMLAP